MSVSHNGGTCWGVQYHPEYDIHELARLTFCRTEKLTKMGFFKYGAAPLCFSTCRVSIMRLSLSPSPGVAAPLPLCVTGM